jgi:hypothetical protein
METPAIYTKEEAAELREKIIAHAIVPLIRAGFDKYPQLQSAMLLVAQYWDDEADDAVHYDLIFSVLPTPVTNVELGDTDDYVDDNPVNLPGLPSSYEIYSPACSQIKYNEYYWQDNENAVATFAAYCKEGGSQDMDYSEAYTPYAVFRRQEGDIEIEIVGTMLRPWLDGARPDLLNR